MIYLILMTNKPLLVVIPLHILFGMWLGNKAIPVFIDVKNSGKLCVCGIGWFSKYAPLPDVLKS